MILGKIESEATKEMRKGRRNIIRKEVKTEIGMLNVNRESAN